jgi:hypothetical protein
LEKNKDYRAFRYGDRLEPGYKLEIEHSISCENVDISTLIAQGVDNLTAMRQESVDSEQKAYDIVVAAAKQWEKQAVTTQLINRAMEYLKVPEAEHSSNQWRKNPRNDDWDEISNKVYKMNCRVREDTSYDRSTGKWVPKAWYVTWDLYLNTPKNGHNIHIAGQDRKRYTDKEAAYKYLDGRKKAYDHLFTELSPAIPKQYEQHFMVHGALLPGYTVEGQERAAKKPSVLGQLATAKAQEKSAGDKPAAKKKEDMQL